MRVVCLLLLPLLWACGEARAVPDWEQYRSVAAPHKQTEGYVKKPQATSFARAERFTFHFRDLKNESDQSLATRLLGANGARIAFIDRHQDRWRYYESDDDAAESLDLYTHPRSWGSAFGICAVEKYSISFDQNGNIGSVQVEPRFGVEGPIFQKKDFDWDYARGRMCADVPPDHAPTYFPAKDGLAAQDMATLMVTAIDEVRSKQTLSFALNCKTFRGDKCETDIRDYLGKLRLNDINETSLINCPHPQKLKDVCFTITVGEGNIGRFPKILTLTGSTYLHNMRIYSVDIVESYTFH
jgi:hypothetical protein